MGNVQQRVKKASQAFSSFLHHLGCKMLACHLLQTEDYSKTMDYEIRDRYLRVQREHSSWRNQQLSRRKKEQNQKENTELSRGRWKDEDMGRIGKRKGKSMWTGGKMSVSVKEGGGRNHPSQTYWFKK